MKGILVALWSESLKIYRSRVFWFSVVFFVFIAFMMGLLMFVQIHPEISERLGLIGTKASMLRFGEPNWQNYFALLNQTIAAIGFIGYGFVTSWVFGREFSDKTAKDILALPVSRSCIVFSKFIVSLIWCIILTLMLFVSALLIGKTVALSGWTNQYFHSFSETFVMVSVLTMLLCTPVAFFASLGRGYLLPFAFIILSLILANFIGFLGVGPYFPWSIPGMLSVPSSEGMQLSVISYLILALTFIIGYIATERWWCYADHV
ncbi:MAG: ABC transporter permease subunit [Bacteroidales bacterium]|nr:ABC transporter permease subunit [Bacteroidales bacterium]